MREGREGWKMASRHFVDLDQRNASGREGGAADADPVKPMEASKRNRRQNKLGGVREND